MSGDILVALVSLIGTIFGSLMGVFSMSKLMTYRIGLLEDKVLKLGDLLERMTIAEIKIKDIDNYVKDNCE